MRVELLLQALKDIEDPEVRERYSKQRPRVIYQKRGEYEEALRVCKSYLAMDDQYQQVVSDQPEWRNGARQHFEKWCTKLEAQVSRQESEVILIYLLERMG